MTKSTRLQLGIAQAKMKKATEIVVPDLRSTPSGALSLSLSIRAWWACADGFGLEFGVRVFLNIFGFKVPVVCIWPSRVSVHCWGKFLLQDSWVIIVPRRLRTTAAHGVNLRVPKFQN